MVGDADVGPREVYERAQAALDAIGSGDRFAARRAIEALEVARDWALAALTRDAEDTASAG
jgi:hypothetical protein